jgi:hypothetical protein
VTIGIVGTSNINLALVDAYRTLFGLPAGRLNVIRIYVTRIYLK